MEKTLKKKTFIQPGKCGKLFQTIGIEDRCLIIKKITLFHKEGGLSYINHWHNSLSSPIN